MYVKDPVKVSMAIQGKSEHRRRRKIHGSVIDGLQDKMLKCEDTHVGIYHNFRNVYSTNLECMHSNFSLPNICY